MFGFFKKDPIKALEKKYQKKLEEARDIQRSGDVKAAALLYEEAEEIGKELQKLAKQR